MFLMFRTKEKYGMFLGNIYRLQAKPGHALLCLRILAKRLEFEKYI